MASFDNRVTPIYNIPRKCARKQASDIALRLEEVHQHCNQRASDCLLKNSCQGASISNTMATTSFACTPSYSMTLASSSGCRAAKCASTDSTRSATQVGLMRCLCRYVVSRLGDTQICARRNGSSSCANLECIMQHLVGAHRGCASMCDSSLLQVKVERGRNCQSARRLT